MSYDKISLPPLGDPALWWGSSKPNRHIES